MFFYSNHWESNWCADFQHRSYFPIIEQPFQPLPRSATKLAAFLLVAPVFPLLYWAFPVFLISSYGSVGSDEQSVFIVERRAVWAFNASVLSLANTFWATDCKHVVARYCGATVLLLPVMSAVLFDCYCHKDADKQNSESFIALMRIQFVMPDHKLVHISSR